ncbi:MAG: 16S rRNA (cytosine(1402)-N(4))-methyltransferase RsmH [Muribaculaceae bacterium]|nr:16S rRNA (cytosine(1402)-N(4))-methyltransferase RsmH [Muribaculaceae bacterium]
MEQSVYHIPALLKETIDGLNIKPDGTYVDVTFGGGGHSRAIIDNLSSNGSLLAFDQDIDAFQNAIEDKRFTFVHSNFRFLKNFLRFHGVTAVDGIVADLGVSFHHFDDEKRGFSFRFDGRLDMRMNKNASISAADILNNYSEQQIADILYLFGELKSARRIAAAIIKHRNAGGVFSSVQSLIDVVAKFISPANQKKELAQIFQAFRIEVNNEIDALHRLLVQANIVLKPGGRLCVLTYHSIEDRIVKNFFKSGNINGDIQKDFFGKISTPFRLVNNKVITPSDDEISANPRSRSAKLRIAEKI